MSLDYGGWDPHLELQFEHRADKQGDLSQSLDHSIKRHHQQQKLLMEIGKSIVSRLATVEWGEQRAPLPCLEEFSSK